MAAILNRDIANIKRYYNTEKGRVDVAAIAEKLLPPLSSMTLNKHPYHSVLLIPAVHGLAGVGNLKVIFEVRTDMTTVRGGEQEPKRSWRLECVKDMTYVQRQPDISAQARGLMQQLSIQANSVVPEPDFSIRVATLRRHIEAVGIELNDALEIMIGEFEKAEADAGMAAPTAPAAGKKAAPAKPAAPKRGSKKAVVPPAPKNDDLL